MDLKRYKAKIKNQLLAGIDQQVKKERAIAEGDYVSKRSNGINIPHYRIPKGHFDDLIRKMNEFKGPVIDMPGHVTSHSDGSGAGAENGLDDSVDVGGSFIGKNVVRARKKCGTVFKKKPIRVESDGDDSADDDEEVTGGKFNFVKSMKHMGHSLDKTGHEFGTALKKAGIAEGSKVLAQEGVKFAKNNIGKMIQGAEEVLPEALPVMEETAPLLLAAGMKKPKRTRKISQKEANRHALIRKLMQQHGCSLAEASKHIKDKGLSY